MSYDRRSFLSRLSFAPAGIATPFLSLSGREVSVTGDRETQGTGSDAMGMIDIRAYGAEGDGRTDDTQALRNARQAAIEQNAPLLAPAGTYVLSDTVNLDSTYLWGQGIGRTTFLVAGSHHAAFRLTRDGSPGSGIAHCTIKGNGSTNDGLLLETGRHARVLHVQAEDLTEGTGFHFRNRDGGWTESNLLVGCRTSRCRHAFRFSQHPDNPGTGSFGYNKIVAFTVSRMLPNSTGIHVEAGRPLPTLYGGHLSGNIYLDDSETCWGLRVEGNFSENILHVSGERIGEEASPRALDVRAGAVFRRNSGAFLFQRGVALHVHPDASAHDNHLSTYDGRRFDYGVGAPKPASGLRMQARERQTLGSGAATRLKLEPAGHGRQHLRPQTGSELHLTGSYLASVRVAVHLDEEAGLFRVWIERPGTGRELITSRRNLGPGEVVLSGNAVLRLDDADAGVEVLLQTDSAAAVRPGPDRTWLELHPLPSATA